MFYEIRYLINHLCFIHMHTSHIYLRTSDLDVNFDQVMPHFSKGVSWKKISHAPPLLSYFTWSRIWFNLSIWGPLEGSEGRACDHVTGDSRACVMWPAIVERVVMWPAIVERVVLLWLLFHVSHAYYSHFLSFQSFINLSEWATKLSELVRTLYHCIIRCWCFVAEHFCEWTLWISRIYCYIVTIFFF